MPYKDLLFIVKCVLAVPMWSAIAGLFCVATGQILLQMPKYSLCNYS